MVDDSDDGVFYSQDRFVEHLDPGIQLSGAERRDRGQTAKVKAAPLLLLVIAVSSRYRNHNAPDYFLVEKMPHPEFRGQSDGKWHIHNLQLPICQSRSDRHRPSHHSQKSSLVFSKRPLHKEHI